MASGRYPDASGSSTTWAQDRRADIQTRAPTIVNIAEFNCSNVSQDFIVAAGSGTAITAAAVDVPGGGIKLSTGTTNGSIKQLEPLGYNIATATQRPSFTDNLKTSPWAVMTQVKVEVAVSGDSQTIFCAANGGSSQVDIYYGLFGGDDLTHLELYVNGSGTTKVVTNLVPTFNAWHNVGIVFDGTTIWGYLDGVYSSTGVTDLTNVPNGGGGNVGRIYVYNGTTGADKTMHIARCAFFSTGVTIG